MSKRKGRDESLSEFEAQLAQEAALRERGGEGAGEESGAAPLGSNERRDADGVLYEFDPAKQAWFPKIDNDFIANYQMNYGVDQSQKVATVATVAPPTASMTDDSFWTNPPADINSPEYRAWYEQYCQYYSYYTQQGDWVGQSEGGQAGGEGGQGGAEGSREGVSTGVNSETFNADVQKTDPPAKGKEKLQTDAEKKAKLLKTKAPAPPPTWFELEEERNRNVYVSGLPDDVTDAEFAELMGKVGIVEFDPVLRRVKAKLYRDSTGRPKGDGRCCYAMRESVEMALQLIDGSELRGHVVSVEPAHFELKGAYDPAKKKRKLTNKEKKKLKEKKEKLLGWQPDKPEEGARPKWERVVVIKHLFNPKDFETDAALMTDISADLRQECAKFGDVRKVVVYDRHVEGVATVMFRAPEEADLCVKATEGRWFASRRLSAQLWDGRTKYLVEETEAEMEARLNQWQAFLEGGGVATGEGNQAPPHGVAAEGKKMASVDGAQGITVEKSKAGDENSAAAQNEDSVVENTNVKAKTELYERTTVVESENSAVKEEESTAGSSRCVSEECAASSDSNSTSKINSASGSVMCDGAEKL